MAATTDWLVWPRWTRYKLHTDGWVYAAGKRAKPCHVGPDLGLVNAFANAGRGDVDETITALLHFYKRYGLLGQTLGGGELGLDGPRAATFSGQREVRAGDDSGWAVCHVLNVRLCLSLAYPLNRRAWQQLKAKLNSLADRQDAQVAVDELQIQVPILVPMTFAPWVRQLPFSIRQALDRESEPRVARRVLDELISPSLATVTRVLDPETGTPRFRFRALIETIYWQIADLVGTSALKQCECGALFFARDRRQQHCPPLPGIRESPCAKRFRMRRLRRGARRRKYR